MATYRFDQCVRYGVYMSLRPLSARFVSADGASLEGAQGATYRRLPTILVVALGPLIGGAFVLAFPLIVAGALLLALGRLTMRALRHSADRSAHLAKVRWEPATAYLHSGETGSDGVPDDDPQQEALDDLEHEVAERRAAEEMD